MPRAQAALDVRHDVHDLAVALDEELVGDADGADLGHPADVVAPEIEQHQVLGALLGIGEQLLLQRLVLVRRRPARPRAGDRPDRDRRRRARAPGSPGSSPATAKLAEIEVVEERRRIDPAQRAIERERRQREGRLEALRQHHLEDVAGRDVVLGAQHHRGVLGRRRVRGRRDRERAGVAVGRAQDQRVEAVDDGGQPFDREIEGDAGRHVRVRPHRRDHRDAVLDRVEHHHQASAGSARRRECRSGPDWAAGAPPSAAPCRSRDSRRCRPPCGGRLSGSAMRLSAISARIASSGASGTATKASRPVARVAIDLGAAVAQAPDQVGIEPDDRVASAHRAALDGFEQEAHRPAGGELEEGGDRRLEVGDETWSTPPAASPRR